MVVEEDSAQVTAVGSSQAQWTTRASACRKIEAGGVIVGDGTAGRPRPSRAWPPAAAAAAGGRGRAVAGADVSFRSDRYARFALSELEVVSSSRPLSEVAQRQCGVYKSSSPSLRGLQDKVSLRRAAPIDKLPRFHRGLVRLQHVRAPAGWSRLFCSSQPQQLPSIGGLATVWQATRRGFHRRLLCSLLCHRRRHRLHHTRRLYLRT